jgi:hypothetical protein
MRVLSLLNILRRKWGSVEMVFDWLDEERTPYLTMNDRMILVLYDLGITDKAQLSKITGWTDQQIIGAFNRIRKMGKDDWLRFWKIKPTRPNVYTLGPKAIAYARELRQEYADEKRTGGRKGQIHHTMGTNQILVRLLESDLEVETWRSTRESMSWLYHSLGLARKPKKERKLKIRPDAMVKVNGYELFVEYDTGTESIPRIEEKCYNYLDLSNDLEEKMLPILFVTINQDRVRDCVKAANRAYKEWSRERRGYELFFKMIYFCLEGDEVSDIKGIDESKWVCN